MVRFRQPYIKLAILTFYYGREATGCNKRVKGGVRKFAGPSYILSEELCGDYALAIAFAAMRFPFCNDWCGLGNNSAAVN